MAHCNIYCQFFFASYKETLTYSTFKHLESTLSLWSIFSCCSLGVLQLAWRIAGDRNVLSVVCLLILFKRHLKNFKESPQADRTTSSFQKKKVNIVFMYFSYSVLTQPQLVAIFLHHPRMEDCRMELQEESSLQEEMKEWQEEESQRWHILQSKAVSARGSLRVRS